MASSPTLGARSDSCEDDSASFSSSASDSPPSYSPVPCPTAGRQRRQRTSSCRSTGSQSSARKPPLDKSLPKLCVICGDKAKGVNFNALTCMSCKAFFRRNALRNKEMKCPFQDRCSVDKITRKFCSKCRLKKCFDSGMKKEWILSEEEKLAIKEKIARNRARRQEENAGLAQSAPASTGGFLDGGTRKRGRKGDPTGPSNRTAPVDEYACDILDGLDFVGVEQLSGHVNSTSMGLFAGFPHNHHHHHHHHHQLSQHNAQQHPGTGHQMAPPTQTHTSNPTSGQQQSAGLFCLEPFDTLTISGGEQVFEWSGAAGQQSAPVHSSSTELVESLTSDLNDCCQILFAHDLFDTDDVLKGDLLEMEQSSSSSSDFSQYLLHGTDPNIQNGRCVPLLSCAQQAQQGASTEGVVAATSLPHNSNPNTTTATPPPVTSSSSAYTGTLPRRAHVMARLTINGDDPEAELPDFLSACLGSNNVLASESDIRDPACDLDTIYSCPPHVTLPDDLAFLTGGLIQPEKELIAELSGASKALESPYRRIIDYDRCESLRTCRITEHTLLRLVSMSKRLSTFGQLPIQDRVKLLKNNLLEMLAIRSVLLYIPEREAWSMINDDFKINVLIKMNVIRPFCTRANWQRHRDFPTLFRTEWLRDTLIIDLLTVIVLFTPRGNLADQNAATDGQMRYSYLLRRYLETKYGCNSTSKEVYDRLMACVKEMRELNADIVNFFRGYHRLIGGSPLFTQILELPPTSECIERHNEILSALTDESSGYSSAHTPDFCMQAAGSPPSSLHAQLQNAVLFNQGMSTGVDLAGQAASCPISVAQSAGQPDNCFGILNSVN